MDIKFKNHTEHWKYNTSKRFVDGIEAICVLKEVTQENMGTLRFSLFWYEDYDGMGYVITVEDLKTKELP